MLALLSLFYTTLEDSYHTTLVPEPICYSSVFIFWGDGIKHAHYLVQFVDNSTIVHIYNYHV